VETKQHLFKELESIFIEKDNSIETSDEEFDDLFRFITEELDRGA